MGWESTAQDHYFCLPWRCGDVSFRPFSSGLTRHCSAMSSSVDPIGQSQLNIKLQETQFSKLKSLLAMNGTQMPKLFVQNKKSNQVSTLLIVVVIHVKVKSVRDPFLIYQGQTPKNLYLSENKDIKVNILPLPGQLIIQ